MKYKVCQAEIIDGKVSIPEGAISLKFGLILTKPFNDSECRMADGVIYLVPTRDEEE